MIEVRLFLKPAKERVKTLKKLLDRIEEEARKHGYYVVSHETRYKRIEDEWVWF